MLKFSPSWRYDALRGATWFSFLMAAVLVLAGAYLLDPALAIVAAGIMLFRGAGAFSEVAIVQLYREHDAFVEGAATVAGSDDAPTFYYPGDVQ